MEVEDLNQTKQSPPSDPPAPLGSSLPAKESRAREYLSNERTYLSWMRSAISLMGLGVILVRVQVFLPPLAPSPEITWKIGFMLSIVGLVTVFLATQHYFAIRQEIAEDDYEPTGRWVILLSLVMLLMGAGLIYYVFTYVPVVLEDLL